MLKVWVGLEARSFLQASIDTVCNMTHVLRCITNNILGRAIRQIRSTITQCIIGRRAVVYYVGFVVNTSTRVLAVVTGWYGGRRLCLEL